MDRILLMGSCFAGHLGDFFRRHKFRTLSNPTGIVFNPVSLARNLSLAVSTESMRDHQSLIVSQDDYWYSLLHHGQFANKERAELIRKLDLASSSTSDFLRSAHTLIITLGSAHVYRHRSTDTIVANCHKIPASEFLKELLSVSVVVEALEQTFEILRQINPDLQILLTVSPVRYKRDGLIANNHSKAVLLMATHQLIAKHSYCHYFPAYEIQIDELRDYRFFDRDMVHPSQQAIEYILNKFIGVYLTEEAMDQVHAIRSLHEALEHRPLHPDSGANQRLVSSLFTKLSDLKKRYPELDFSDEEATLNRLKL